MSDTNRDRYDQTLNRAVSIVRQMAVAAISLAAIVQFVLSQDEDNYLATLLIWIGSCVTFFYVFRVRLIQLAPLSALAVLGFNVTALSGALIIQSLDITPVIFNLKLPRQTFVTLFLAQIILILAHLIYVRVQALQSARGAMQRLLQRFGAFEQVNFFQLICFGVIGLAAAWYNNVSLEGDVQYGDVVGKATQALTFLAIAPFLGLVRGLYTGRAIGIDRQRVVLVAGYFFLLMGVAFARNSRYFFAVAIATVLLDYFLGILTGYVALTRARLGIIGLIALCAVPTFGVLSDLSTAMVIARADRTTVFGFELIRQTLSIAADREALQQYRAMENRLLENISYNEVYISNPILARMIIVRYHDNILFAAEGFNEADRMRVLENIGERILANLPTPVLRLLGSDLDKQTLSYSSGDLFYALYASDPLGGYRTGSAVAEGLTVMGVFFLPMLLLLAIVVFLSMDCFVIRLSNRRVIFSIIALLQLWTIFIGPFVLDSIAGIPNYVIRTVPQNLVICLVLFKLTRAISGKFASGNLRK